MKQVNRSCGFSIHQSKRHIRRVNTLGELKYNADGKLKSTRFIKEGVARAFFHDDQKEIKWTLIVLCTNGLEGLKKGKGSGSAPLS